MKAWVTRTSVIGACACAIAIAVAAYAADHKDSPSVTAEPATDITDVYAFKDGSNLVMIVDVNGFSGPVATEDFRFATDALYLIHVDTDAAPGTDEKKYTIQFADKGDAQWIRVRGSGHGTGANDDLVGEINTAADSNTPKTITSGDSAMKVFAGPRDDPFFFSLLGNGGTYHGFTTCTTGAMCFLGVCNRANPSVGCLSGGTAAPYPVGSVDTFAGFNVSSIVIEVPLADFTGTNLGIWASTAR